jgi:hypothetical protein
MPSSILAAFSNPYTIDDNGCWNCTAPSRNKNKRPNITIGTRGANLARVLCFEKHGPPPDSSMHACHSCNNPQCINPDHIDWGDAVTNMRQGYIKSRNLPRNINKSPGGYVIRVLRNGKVLHGWATSVEEAIEIRDDIIRNA